MPNTPHTPHTPHTPVGTPHTPGGPPSVPPNDTSNHNTSGEVTSDHSTDLPSDLNFDPAAVIDGEGTGQEALNVSNFYRNIVFIWYFMLHQSIP